MNELKVLNEQEVLGKQFRVYGTAEEPLFLAKDVAEWIEYDTSSVNKMMMKRFGRMFRPLEEYRNHGFLLRTDFMKS